MDLCKEDQIKNPTTNRCVSIKGTIGKKIIKKHIAGEITLNPENVKKISTKLQSPKISSPKVPSVKSASPKVLSVKSASPNIPSVKSKCKDDKIYNFITKKCVSIKGATGKNLIKGYKNKEIILDNADIKKIVEQKLLSPIKDVKSSLLKEEDIPEKTKLRIHNFVEEWKKNKNLQNNDDYNKYCKTLKNEDINIPIVDISMTVDFPVTRMIAPIAFSIELLNSPKQKFIYEKIKGIRMRFNNYSLRHLLYKGQPDSIKYVEESFDDEWLIKMNNYVAELTTKKLYTLIGYTYYGDVLANNYMRRKIVKARFTRDLAGYDKWFTNYYPLFFQALDKIGKIKDINGILKDGNDVKVNPIQYYFNGVTLQKNKNFTSSMLVSELFEKMKLDYSLTVADKYCIFYAAGRYLSFSKFWQDVIRQYTYDLDAIIDKAPPTTRKMIVYRGVKDDYYLKGNKNHIYKTDSFVSTSINLPSALRFAGTKCCFKRITLLPGTKTVLLAGISKYKNEIELLLGSKSHFYITKNKGSIPRSTVDMCNDSASVKITVTDLVVVK
jgi:hypothetical protein